ncbi:MAG: hypothetical protein JWP87_1373 [Labilithrix sp.]|nr:hypothetical protein [Labilithrix sp.]
MLEAPRSMEPPAAADVLRRKIADPTKPMTVADASVASGLPLRDAESGLHFLTSEYRGHLRVTEDGDLVHVFPNGFTKPWETREATSRVLSAIGKALFAAGRFVVRAWLLIAMVAYALIFVAIIIGLTFARQSDRDDGVGASAGLMGGLLRAIGDALFWTFHPFSPLYYGYGYGYGGAYADRYAGPRRVSGRDPNEIPFYEKVNRFVFGPTLPPEDPHAMRTRILEEIRVQKGRIGLADVMRVTGLPRDQADPLMARLMLDHEGTVEVAEQGGIVYRFEGLRRTAEVAASTSGTSARATAPSRRAAWETPATLPPLTGNSGGSNLAIALLNAFNLLASAWVLANGLTISNLFTLLTTHPARGAPPIVLPYDGVPIALGLVPFLFSLALFALPALRALARSRKEKKVAQENARLAILREVLTRAPKKEPVPDEALRVAYRVATGVDPTSKEITARVVDLGGDVDVGPEGEVRYRFADLEAEAEALEEERAHAPAEEAKLGRVVFASDE